MGVEQSGTRTNPRLDLGVALMEFIAQESDFIGTQALRLFRAQVQKGVFPAITRECLTRSVNTKRAKRSGYNREGVITVDISFACEEHGLENALDDSERSLYESDFDAELACTKQILNLLLIAQEVRIATALFNTSTWAGATLYTDNSGAPWDAAASDVIGQVLAAKEKVRALTGMKPNALIMSETNRIRLLSNTAIKAAIQYTTIPTEEAVTNALKGLFGVENILIGKAVKNTSNKGKDFSGSDIWSDDYAMVARIAQDSNSLEEPCVGRSMLWVADSPENTTVEQYYEDSIRSDVFRVRQNVDELVIDASFAHLMKVDA
ncbi:MAG: hypothetical protein PHC54_05455 [Candidatus Omnitrophica bacterium]|nr:hypothetical protein [Candidatus Omnitrophota bacterium]MDD5592653.1 hypothetical protein [Candidatus Omnitrophota bacterium]